LLAAERKELRWEMPRRHHRPDSPVEVEIIDHGDVATIEVEGSPVEVEMAYVFKFTVSNANVAERLARNVLAQKRPEAARHSLTVEVREIYRSPKS
jgi:hypothetical protein